MGAKYDCASSLDYYLSRSFLQELLVDECFKNNKNDEKDLQLNDSRFDLCKASNISHEIFALSAVKSKLPFDSGSLAGNVIQEHLHVRDRCRDTDQIENTQNLNCDISEGWFAKLDIVTLKPIRSVNFSICEKVLEPLELIHIAYLLASIDYSLAPLNKSSFKDNQHSLSQKKLLQRLHHYNTECSKSIRKGDIIEEKEIDQHMNEVDESVQLEALIRHILLSHSEEAFDAILTLNDVQFLNTLSRLHEYGGEDQVEIKPACERGSFLNLCVTVIRTISLSEVYCTCRRHSSDGLFPVLSEHQHCDSSVVQNSMLKILLSAGEVITAAQLLLQWGRFQDLSDYCSIVWESVHFMMGDNKKHEEHYPHLQAATLSSDRSWTTVRTRRPLPCFENIIDTDSIENIERVTSANQGGSSFNSPPASRPGVRSNKPINGGNAEDINRGSATLLPPNSSSLLRERLIEASLVQQIMAQIPQQSIAYK